MDKGRIMLLILALVGGVAGFFGVLAMCFTGTAFVKILGINLLEWGMLFLDLGMLVVIGYDAFNLHKRKKAFGEIIFALSSFTFKRQLLGLVMLIACVAYQLYMLIVTPNIMTGSNVFVNVGVVFIILIHNFSKWGVYAKGIGIGGVYFEWARVTGFGMNSSMIEMQVENQLLWLKYESKIKFRYDRAKEAELYRFLKTKTQERQSL